MKSPYSWVGVGSALPPAVRADLPDWLWERLARQYGDEEAMRIAHGLRPGEDNDFSVETADALVEFWKRLTRVLFSAIPAVVAILQSDAFRSGDVHTGLVADVITRGKAKP